MLHVCQSIDAKASPCGVGEHLDLPLLCSYLQFLMSKCPDRSCHRHGYSRWKHLAWSECCGDQLLIARVSARVSALHNFSRGGREVEWKGMFMER